MFAGISYYCKLDWTVPKGERDIPLTHKVQITILSDNISHLENKKLGMLVNSWPKRDHI